MNKSYLSKLLLLAAFLIGSNALLIAQTTFNYTGAVQSYTVPVGVTSVAIEAWGAQGANAADKLTTNASGGLGSYASGTLAVSPGQVLLVYVGGAGSSSGTGGFNGGGTAGLSTAGSSCSGGYAGGGGGASDVRAGGAALTNRVIVAGGGGGAGRDYCNGSCLPCGCGGSGGDADADGTPAGNCGFAFPGSGINNGKKGVLTLVTNLGPGDGGGASGTSGVSGIGGNGAAGTGDVSAGGGGGGFFGGGGGGSAVGGSGVGGGGGGGGSSYTGGVTSGGILTSANSGNGIVKITPGCTAGVITGTKTICGTGTTTLTSATTGGTWSISTTSVATVTSGGIVSGVASGSATITYKLLSGCLSVTPVTVNPAPAAISGTASVCLGITTALSSTTAGGAWTSSATTIATVSGTGVVTGVATGTATISYALTTGCTVTRVATVNPLPAAISGTATVCASLTTALTTTTTGGAWTSSSTGIATVSSAGVVTGVSAGTAIITYAVSATGCLTTKIVTVNPLPANITGTTTVCISSTTALTSATAGGTWASSTARATVVAATGVVSGVTAGTTIITYKLTTGCQVSTQLTVNPLPTAILGTATVCEGLTTGLSDATTGGAWSSGNTSYATVNSSGVVTGVDAGTLSITYTLPTGCLVSRAVTVNETPAAITGIPNVCIGLTTALSSTTPGGTWTSSATGRATVVAGTGVAKGVAAGTATITYRLATGCQATTPLTINPLPTNILGTATVCEGLTTGLSDAATGGSWTSSNTGTATIGATTGVVTGVAAGTSTITYTLPTGCINTRAVTVNPVPAAITGTPTVCVSATTSLTTTTASGTWTSSATGFATVVSSTGVVTGVSSGSLTITYKIATGCIATTPLTVNPLPASITGTTNVCAGLTTALTNATTGGAWSSSNASLATVSSAGVVTGVAAGTPDIIYKLPTGCQVSQIITVNPLPAPFGGPKVVCNGLSVTLSESSTGGVWSSGATTIATVGSTSATTGIVTGISPGTTTITYTLPTGCIMTASFLVNPLPVPITAPVMGACVTNILNPVVTLVNGTPGGVWSSGNTAVAQIISFSGDVTGITAGTAIITYTLPLTGCLVSTPLTINPLPAPITGVTEVCANAVTYLGNTSIGGVWTSGDIALATIDASAGIVTGVSGFSTPTITYTLPTGCKGITTITVNAAPGAVAGTTSVCQGSTTSLTAGGGGTWQSSNSALATITPGPASGGIVTGINPGNPVITYTLPGTGCFNTTTITVNASPATITGFASMCDGSGTTLNNAIPGGTWQSADPTVATIAGGVVTALQPGTSDIDYVLSSGCKSTLTVTVHPKPTIYNLFQPDGKTSFCAGTTGLTMQLNASVNGVYYELYSDGISIGIAGGNGSVLDFGLQRAAGIYTAKARDINGCVSDMTGSPVITINALPDINTFGFTGLSSRYCDGGPGVEVVLDRSQSSFEYTLFIDGNPGPGAYGTGGALSFGTFTTTGLYTAVATDPVTRCESNMSGSVTLGKNPLPAVHNVVVETTLAGVGKYCASDAGVHVGMDYGNTGISYELYDGATLKATNAGANSGVDFGVFPAGTYTVVATNTITGCTLPMSGSATVATVPLPPPHSLRVFGHGSSSYCTGGTGVHIELDGSDNGISYQLYNGLIPVGIGEPGTGLVIDYGDHSITGAYTVVATDAVTQCSLGMTGSVTITMHPSLDIFKVTADNGGNYCDGTPGAVIRTSGSKTGILYQLWNNGVLMQSKPGTGSALVYTPTTVTGAYSVVAVDIASGCSATMNGSPVVTKFTLPAVYNVTVTNGGAYCSGGLGVVVGLSHSDGGINYQLYSGGTAVGALLAGAGSALSFGTYTTTGTYTVEAKNLITGCAVNMNGSAVVTVNAAPVAYNVSGGGSYCAGSVTGVPVGLIKSEVGVNYQLFNNASPVGGAVAGTGSAISFGNQLATGYYTVVATNASAGCVTNMTGSKVITIDPLPVAYNVTGGGTDCAGSSGFHVGVSNSTFGVDYQLWNGYTMLGSLPGTGRAIDFGIKAAAGVYTVVAKTVISGCAEDMAGNAVINFNPLPAIYSIAGGGSYCDGEAGAEVYMFASEPGVYYQLYKAHIATGSPILGTGAGLSFGKMSPGVYTVKATNVATGCAKDMSGIVAVNKKPLPLAYTVTGGGTMCAGDTGYHLLLSGSQVAVDYQLHLAGVATGSPIPGTGVALDFGLNNTAGRYTIVGRNTITGCAIEMNAGATIKVNPAPAAFTVTGGGHYCEKADGVAVGLSGSGAGINYQLYDTSVAMGMPVGGTGAGVTFGLQDAPGLYTVIATNTTTKCKAVMTGTVAVIVDAAVTPAVAISGTDGKACIGDVVNYTASALNGGSAPAYTWRVGGLPKGTGSTFSTIPVIGDVITVEMTSNAYCLATPDAGTSVAMEMIPYVMPTAAINVDPGVAVCSGTPVNMSAIMTNAGDAAGYSWMKNGVFIGTGANLNYTAVNDGDAFVFMLRSSLRCRMSDTVFSDPVVMDVDVAEMPSFSIRSHIDTSAVHVGSVDSFTVEFKAGKHPKGELTYQWYIMGSMVPGATYPVFIDHNIYDNNTVSCEVRRVGACGNQSARRETKVYLKNLGAHHVTSGGDLSILPNPNKGEFTVSGLMDVVNEDAVTLEITNMLGQVVYTDKAEARHGNINKKIQLSSTLPNGMYILNVRSSVASKIFHVVIDR